MHIPSNHRVAHPGDVHGIGGFASQNSRPPLQLKAPKALICVRVTHTTSQFCVTTPSRCLTVLGPVCAPQSGDCHQFPPLELAGCTRFAHAGLTPPYPAPFSSSRMRHSLITRLTPRFRRILPETGCLSQGLPHRKRYACPCPPQTVTHRDGKPSTPLPRRGTIIKPTACSAPSNLPPTHTP